MSGRRNTTTMVKAPMFEAMTYHDVATGLGERPCVDDFKQACKALPDWKTTAYTPSQMAEHGVHHSSILWAWMHDAALPRLWQIEFACRCAERVIPNFATYKPDTSLATNAIAAARKAAIHPSDENKDAAWAAGNAARTAAGAARTAAWAAWAAGAAWYSAAQAVAEAAGSAAEQSEQIEILEAVIAEALKEGDA